MSDIEQPIRKNSSHIERPNFPPPRAVKTMSNKLTIEVGHEFIDAVGNRILVVDTLPNSIICDIIRVDGSKFPNLSVVSREMFDGFRKLENHGYVDTGEEKSDG